MFISRLRVVRLTHRGSLFPDYLGMQVCTNPWRHHRRPPRRLLRTLQHPRSIWQQERRPRQLIMQATLRPTKLSNPHEGAGYSPTQMRSRPPPRPTPAPVQTTPLTSAIAQLRPPPWTRHLLRLCPQCTASTYSNSVTDLPTRPNRVSASNDMYVPSMTENFYCRRTHLHLLTLNGKETEDAGKNAFFRRIQCRCCKNRYFKRF